MYRRTKKERQAPVFDESNHAVEVRIEVERRFAVRCFGIGRKLVFFLNSSFDRVDADSLDDAPDQLLYLQAC